MQGCSAICPEGPAALMCHPSFVLANTESLHEKINQLSNRVRQLEDALSQSHALHSSFSHPLLSEELLQIKRPLERERLDLPNGKDEKGDPNDNIDSMGSLSISHGGRSTFFGQTANSWYLLQNEEGYEDGEDTSSHDSPQPTDIPWLNYAFPFTPPAIKSAETLRGSIIGFLPRYTPIPESDFLENIFRPVYEQDGAFQTSVSAHSLAVLLMVLALGSLLDLDRPAQSPETMQFYQLARAALALDSVLEEQTIPGIQALLLMCHFMFLSDMGGPRWVIMGMIVKMAQSIGLHRDSGKWKLNAEETQKRRELFYELLTYDSWQSLTFGRPPSLSTLHIDSKLPHDTFKNAAGEVEMSFAAWKHRFASQCLSVVHDQAFGARPPNYKAIQDLDRRVRSWYVPPSLQVPGFGGAKPGAELEQPGVELTMQRYIAFAIKEITLFYMHRGYFAQAMEDSPADPMGSKYSPSVLAAYTSACSFVGLIESLFKQHPILTERMWFLFTHVFSCAIVLGSIAVKSKMQIAPSALSHLESAYNLFSQVTDQSRTHKILPILQKLKERAHSALSNTHSQGETATRLSYFGPSIKSEVEELSTLGGMTRLVSRKSPSSPTFSGSSPASQPASPPPLSSAQDGLRFSEAVNSPPWPQYNMQQAPYPDTSTSPYPMQQDMSLVYGGHQTPVEPMQDYYGYSHSGYHAMQLLSPQEESPNQHYLQPFNVPFFKLFLFLIEDGSMPVPDARTRNKISLKPATVLSTSIPTKHIPNILLSNVLVALSLFAAKEWLLNLDVGVFWVLMRVLACGGLGVLVWEGLTGQMAKRKTIEWSVLGMASILMFVKYAALFTALFRLSSNRRVRLMKPHFTGLTLTAQGHPFHSLFGAVDEYIVENDFDTHIFSTNSVHILTGYGALTIHALTSSALDSTLGILSPSLGSTFTIALATLGTSIFALPFYLFRLVLLGFPSEPVLPLMSLASIPVIAYALLFSAPITARSMAHLSYAPQYFKFSYPVISGIAAIFGVLAFTQSPSWSDLFVAGFLYSGMFPDNTDVFAGPPRTPTARLLKAYLKTILSNPESRKIFYFLCLNMCYMMVQMLYGVWTNSLGLISDAIHMAFDCMAIGVGLFASVMATWEPNERFTYGYARIETLSGFANGIFLILISIFIIFEAIQRLLDPPEMNTSQLLLVSSLGLGVNLFGMFAMGGHHHHGGHSHSHGHGHSHASEDSHDHAPPLASAHSHSHAHDQAHDHDHPHSHSHSPPPSEEPRGRSHLHSHSESHPHSHSHSPEPMHVSSPTPDHDHGHSHSHSHSRSHARSPSQIERSHSLPVPATLSHSHSQPDSHSHSHSQPDPHSHSHTPPPLQVPNTNGSTSLKKGHRHHPSIQIHLAPDSALLKDDSILSPLSAGITPSYKFGFGHDEHLAKHHNTGHTHTSAHEGHSDNMRGVFLHVMADTLGSVGVIISTLLIQFYGWTGFDPIASLFIAVLIAASVIPLVVDTGKILALDLSNKDTTIQRALAELSSIQGLASYTEPRFWPKDASTIIGSIHIQLAPSASSVDPGGPHSSQRTTYTRLDRVTERVDALLRQKIPGLEELTIQVEESKG
ncbi:hypothetical protein DXG01_006382 [Tephrocybe rancida]|nr:hypothetical protein DXG01_006382 [Tephrocybe rancida]